MWNRAGSSTQSAATAAQSVADKKESHKPDWAKLLQKPTTFEYASHDAEIKAFGDWSWQVERYLTAIDQGYAEDFKELKDHPNREMAWAVMDEEQQTRGVQMYGLLSGLVRNKALQVLKAVDNMNGT